MRFVCLALLALAGCGSNDHAACASSSSQSLAAVQSRVFSSCGFASGVGCHTAAPFAANLDLTSGDLYSFLVHAPSSSSPGSFRVEPADLDHSFLWRKLTNALASDGSEGLPMPRLPSPAGVEWQPLEQGPLDAIRCWIVNGAPN